MIAASAAASAEPTGIVAETCKGEIEKFCSDKTHGFGEVRLCLETKRSEVSDACKKALDTTGRGQGKGLGKKRSG